MAKKQTLTNTLKFGAKRYIRQSGIINVDSFSENKIAILGCGANGSFIAMALSKMGFRNFELWDYDTVEEHNLPNQFFSELDLGRKKTYATSCSIERFNSQSEIISKGRYNSQKINAEIVISCVDRMSVRKQIFEACKKNKQNQLFIDTRMSGLEGQIYSVDMTDDDSIVTYEKTLFSDVEAVQERCTERSILFTVLGIASIVCNQIVKALKGEDIINYIVIDYNVPQIM